MRKNKSNERFPCDICRKILDTYIEFEKHRSYFHQKDVEKVLETDEKI